MWLFLLIFMIYYVSIPSYIDIGLCIFYLLIYTQKYWQILSAYMASNLAQHVSVMNYNFDLFKFTSVFTSLQNKRFVK